MLWTIFLWLLILQWYKYKCACIVNLTHEMKLKTKKLLQHKYHLLKNYSSPFIILQLHLKHLYHLILILFSLHYNTKSWIKDLHITLFSLISYTLYRDSKNHWNIFLACHQIFKYIKKIPRLIFPSIVKLIVIKKFAKISFPFSIILNLSIGRAHISLDAFQASFNSVAIDLRARRSSENICSSTGGAQEKGKTGWNSIYHQNWWFSEIHPLFNVHVLFCRFF